MSGCRLCFVGLPAAGQQELGRAGLNPPTGKGWLNPPISALRFPSIARAPRSREDSDGRLMPCAMLRFCFGAIDLGLLPLRNKKHIATATRLAWGVASYHRTPTVGGRALPWGALLCLCPSSGSMKCGTALRRHRGTFQCCVGRAPPTRRGNNPR